MVSFWFWCRDKKFVKKPSCEIYGSVYKHVDLISNHVKIVFGTDKNKTKSNKKDVSGVSSG